MEHSSNQNRTILVTGSAGFIGYHTARALLERGDAVIGIDNHSSYYDPEVKRRREEQLQQYEHYTGYQLSIADYHALADVVHSTQPDTIIHLAAQAGVRYSLTDPWTYEDANNRGTLNVFEAARHNDIARVIFASSSSVYGANEKMPFSEDDRTDHPISMYAATKKANEALAYAYHHLYGIETAGIRFFTVYGEYGRPDMAVFRFAQNILSGKPITLYNAGDMQRSFTYVTDAVQGVLALADADTLGYELYNIGGDTPAQLTRVVELLEQHIGVRAEVEYAPMQPGDVQVTHADTSKAEHDLGYAPQVSIDDGVARFTQWFTQNSEWLLELEEPKQ
jgi:UDP-glucuronate 4-epimerase